MKTIERAIAAVFVTVILISLGSLLYGVFTGEVNLATAFFGK